MEGGSHGNRKHLCFSFSFSHQPSLKFQRSKNGTNIHRELGKDYQSHKLYTCFCLVQCLHLLLNINKDLLNECIGKESRAFPIN